MVVEDLELLRELEQLVLTLTQPLLCGGRTSLGRSWRREKSEPRRSPVNYRQPSWSVALSVQLSIVQANIPSFFWLYFLAIPEILPLSSGLLGSKPTGLPAWMNSLDSQAAMWRNQNTMGRLAASFTTIPQPRAASRATPSSNRLSGRRGSKGIRRYDDRALFWHVN